MAYSVPLVTVQTKSAPTLIKSASTGAERRTNARSYANMNLKNASHSALAFVRDFCPNAMIASISASQTTSAAKTNAKETTSLRLK